jgi:hypothetical protein
MNCGMQISAEELCAYVQKLNHFLQAEYFRQVQIPVVALSLSESYINVDFLLSRKNTASPLHKAIG